MNDTLNAVWVKTQNDDPHDDQCPRGILIPGPLGPFTAGLTLSGDSHAPHPRSLPQAAPRLAGPLVAMTREPALCKPLTCPGLGGPSQVGILAPWLPLSSLDTGTELELPASPGSWDDREPPEE